MSAGSVKMMTAEADLFNSGAEIMVNPVDTTGAQGAGLAKLFAARFPDAARLYRRCARSGCMTPGDIWPTIVPDGGNGSVEILFVATKRHYREPSMLDYVRLGLHAIASYVIWSGSHSVAIPALGCGLGGLSWSRSVAPITREAAAKMARAGVDVLVFPPHERKTGGA